VRRQALGSARGNVQSTCLPYDTGGRLDTQQKRGTSQAECMQLPSELVRQTAQYVVEDDHVVSGLLRRKIPIYFDGARRVEGLYRRVVATVCQREQGLPRCGAESLHEPRKRHATQFADFRYSQSDEALAHMPIDAPEAAHRKGSEKCLCL